ncbi:MAG: mannose-6-phosphate isomerase, class I [Corynebacterium sp.]|nr:mannose-6-phosphate isomerase, class I [Corynebacterium sp.]
MQLLTPSTQAYAWGSRTLIQELRGQQPGGSPIAELWYGAHPAGPSQVAGESLVDLIAENPDVLGENVRETYGDRLPFLLKLLAADLPLSLQAHPSKAQAEEGFARDNAAGLELTAGNRNYRDDNHKPELIVALSEFHAMAGFRPLAQTRELFEVLDCPELDRYLSLTVADPEFEEANLRALFTTWITIPAQARIELIDAVIAAANKTIPNAKPWMAQALRNIVELNEHYPHDIGVLGALLLNYVVLQPGQALFLGAGNLHAYVRGLGVEIMANSDNVLRGGLTAKHINVPELVRVLRFSPLADVIVDPEGTHYPVPVPDFAIERVEIADAITRDLGQRPGIALCTAGELKVGDVEIAPAQAVWIPAHEGPWQVSGTGELFIATVGA